MAETYSVAFSPSSILPLEGWAVIWGAVPDGAGAALGGGDPSSAGDGSSSGTDSRGDVGAVGEEHAAARTNTRSQESAGVRRTAPTLQLQYHPDGRPRRQRTARFFAVGAAGPFRYVVQIPFVSRVSQHLAHRRVWVHDRARTTIVRRLVAVLITSSALAAGCTTIQEMTPTVASSFIYEYNEARFRAGHASTIVETSEGLVAAWFGGTAEGNPDTSIWLARLNGDRWTAPVEVADGRQADGQRYPCWNPVLFQPSNGPLLLFYRVGPNPREWWALAQTSIDGGRTWSTAITLPDGTLGPIRAKPIELPSGTILAGSSTEHDGWVARVERLDTPGGLEDEWQTALAAPAAWTRSQPLNDADTFSAIQPTILAHSPTKLQVLARSQQGVITQAWSDDAGQSWGSMTATELPNPSSGIDSVRLADGRFLLVYNPTAGGRHRLAVAVSDDGLTWNEVLMLEDAAGEYSYPAVIQARNGLIHVTYTWKRKHIKHVVLDPAGIS